MHVLVFYPLLHIAVCFIRNTLASVTPWRLGCGPESIRVRFVEENGLETDFCSKTSVFVTLYLPTNGPHACYRTARCQKNKRTKCKAF